MAAKTKTTKSMNLANTDLMAKVQESVEHIRDRAAEVSEAMPDGWSVSIAEDSRSEPRVLVVRRQDADVGRMQFRPLPTGAELQVWALHPGATAVHVGTLVNAVHAAVEADKRVLREIEAQNERDADAIFAELSM